MNKLCGRPFPLICVFLVPMAAWASNLDTIGITLLRAVTTNLNGAGIRVAQPEGNYNLGTNWEVNPSTVSQPANLITYISSAGSTNVFPNSLSSESWHAGAVGGNFYGMTGGVATNVTHVDNYDANYFWSSVVDASSPTNINAPVVNQSFVFCNSDNSHYPVSTEQFIDSQYDNYAAQYKTLFISGAGNGGPTNQARVYPAATCYNGLGVAAYGGYSCIGPTLDNGRAKPDITAPESATSYSTPQVAGAAAVLMQAGLRGDGGNDTNAAADIRTVKALLLNGAIKPADWTNGAAAPLDARYGAGVLNVFNAYEQLAGQKQTNLVPGSVSTGAAHPPTGATNTIGAWSGWSFTNLTSSSSLDAVAHYYFNVTNGINNATFTATATLVWNRQQNKTGINKLHLFLYDTANSNLVTVCTSAVDNVQHLFVPALPPGRYDLQVLKKGGSYVSASETYALAFEFFSMPLSAAQSDTNIIFQWLVYPAGFVLESATDLISPVLWNTNNPASGVTNGQNCVVLNATNGCQFFRLRRP
jgi:hypothetical protein